jgi:hypothetical protein
MQGALLSSKIDVKCIHGSTNKGLPGFLFERVLRAGLHLGSRSKRELGMQRRVQGGLLTSITKQYKRWFRLELLCKSRNDHRSSESTTVPS